VGLQQSVLGSVVCILAVSKLNEESEKRLFTHDSQFMAPEKRYEPANKGISEHSSMVPEPEMLNTCLNCHCHIESKGLRGF